jgi:hypothetical protein
MYTIACENCNDPIEFDYDSTLEEYLTRNSLLKGDIDDLLGETIESPLVYVCINCKNIYRYTYKDIIDRIKLLMKWDIMNIRKANMLKKDISFELIKPGCGIEYCGQCSGVDGKGNCSVDLIKQCTIRKT